MKNIIAEIKNIGRETSSSDIFDKTLEKSTLVSSCTCGLIEPKSKELIKVYNLSDSLRINLIQYSIELMKIRNKIKVIENAVTRLFNPVLIIRLYNGSKI